MSLADNEKVTTMKPGNTLENKAAVRKDTAPCWPAARSPAEGQGQQFKMALQCVLGGWRDFHAVTTGEQRHGAAVTLPPSEWPSKHALWKVSYLQRKKRNKQNDQWHFFSYNAFQKHQQWGGEL